jgi:hypothetical protein
VSRWQFKRIPTLGLVDMSNSNPELPAGQNWTTKEQFVYLQSKRPLYEAAQNSGRKFSDFWVAVFEYFFAHWPPPTLTEEEKAAGLNDGFHADALKTVRLFISLVSDIQLTHPVFSRDFASGLITI